MPRHIRRKPADVWLLEWRAVLMKEFMAVNNRIEFRVADHRWRTTVRLVTVLCVALGLFLCAESIRAQNASDDQAIRAILKGFSDIWARADIKAFEELLTEDADWVVRSGTYLKGRPAVVKHHAEIMTGSFAGSRVVWEPLAVRFVRPDVAVAHVAAQLTLKDGTRRTPGNVTLVFVKTNRGWRITAVQNTDRS